MRTIFIAKTERLLCDALCSCCTSLGLKVIGSSTDGRESLDLIQQLQPDFAIVEGGLPSINGFEIIEQLKRDQVNTQTILYLQNHNPDFLRKALSLNVNSLLFAEDGLEKLSQCFDEKNYVSPFVNHRRENRVKELTFDTKQDLLNSLTPAQLKILALVGTHKTMPEIAEKLFISPHTVNNHIANIRRKLDLRGRGVVLKYALAIKHKLVEIDGKVLVSHNSYDYSPV
ncbi:MAG: LuxR C-terminal-related transcriptional regulator [Saprospiraceae bacterium]